MSVVLLKIANFFHQNLPNIPFIDSEYCMSPIKESNTMAPNIEFMCNESLSLVQSE